MNKYIGISKMENEFSKSENNNLFEIKIANELLINIISFLLCEYTYICKRVCKTWFNNLKSNLSKKILTQIPKKICFSKSYKVDFVPKKIVRIGNFIYVTNNLNVYKFDIKTSELIEENNIHLQKNLISSNDNHICTSNILAGYVYIFSPNIELINTIKVNGIICGLEIDDNNRILIPTCDKFFIYNIKGNIINSWDLDSNLIRTHISRKIMINRNEIYMVDTSYFRICVFSYDGTLIRSWGYYGNLPGQFNYPWGIIIHRGIIFVVDSQNSRIQAFTRHGKFIFEEKYKDNSDMGDIIIVDDYAYINDWFGCCLIKSKLIYD
jgi:hypothetical protein